MKPNNKQDTKNMSSFVLFNFTFTNILNQTLMVQNIKGWQKQKSMFCSP